MKQRKIDKEEKSILERVGITLCASQCTPSRADPDPGFTLAVSSRTWVVNAALEHQKWAHSCCRSLQTHKHQRCFPLSLQFPGARAHISAHHQNSPVSDRAEQLGMQAFLFLNPRQAMAGEAFARHAEHTRDWHIPLNIATAEGPLGRVLLLADTAKALTRAAEKHLCFPSSYLQDLGTQPRPTLSFPSQARRKAVFPGKRKFVEERGPLWL